MAELADNAIQLFFVFVCGLYSLFRLLKTKSYNWLFIVLFYLSFGIGMTYWVLYIVLFNCPPQVFCISELNWTASYIFLAMRLAYGENETQRRCRNNPLFWILPAFSLVMGIFFLIRGSYFENVLMGSGIAVCGFYAVRGLYFARKSNNKGRIWICGAVIFFYAAEYLLWLSSYFWVDGTFLNPYFLADTFVLNPALILLAAAGRKEDGLCHTI